MVTGKHLSPSALHLRKEQVEKGRGVSVTPIVRRGLKVSFLEFLNLF